MAKVYISKDKSPKMQKMEMYTKRLHRAVCTLLHDTPDFKIYRDLMGGVVSVGWQKLVKLELPARDEPPR
eukprot:8741201-Karenia_brevis.AAC.1